MAQHFRFGEPNKDPGHKGIILSIIFDLIVIILLSSFANRSPQLLLLLSNLRHGRFERSSRPKGQFSELYRQPITHRGNRATHFTRPTI